MFVVQNQRFVKSAVNGLVILKKHESEENSLLYFLFFIGKQEQTLGKVWKVGIVMTLVHS